MRKLTLGVLLVSSTIALPVIAENGNSIPADSESNVSTDKVTTFSNFSAELLLGTANQKSEISGFGSTSGDDTSIGVRGAYNINKNVALELAYHLYGETEDSYTDEYGDIITDKVSSSSLNIGVKGILPLDKGFSLHGRAGLALWDAELEETDSYFPGEKIKMDDSGTDLYYGLGMQYQLNQQLNIGVEYTIINMGVSLSGVSVDHDVKNLSLSLGYNF